MLAGLRLLSLVLMLLYWKITLPLFATIIILSIINVFYKSFKDASKKIELKEKYKKLFYEHFSKEIPYTNNTDSIYEYILGIYNQNKDYSYNELLQLKNKISQNLNSARVLTSIKIPAILLTLNMQPKSRYIDIEQAILQNLINWASLCIGGFELLFKEIIQKLRVKNSYKEQNNYRQQQSYNYKKQKTSPNSKTTSSIEGYLKIIEVKSGAKKEEIKKAYRALILKNHPDKMMSLSENVRKAAEEKVKKINFAYNHLKKLGYV